MDSAHRLVTSYVFHRRVTGTGRQRPEPKGTWLVHRKPYDWPVASFNRDSYLSGPCGSTRDTGCMPQHGRQDAAHVHSC